MNKIQEQQGKITYQILNDFYSCLDSSIKNYSVYYKNGESLIDIITIIPRDDEETETKIYSFEAKILNKYSNKIDIDFHLMPKYQEPLKDCVPQNFKRYVPKLATS